MAGIMTIDGMTCDPLTDPTRLLFEVLSGNTSQEPKLHGLIVENASIAASEAPLRPLVLAKRATMR